MDEGVACPWTSASECAMAREREAAGRTDEIATCPVHGAPVTCEGYGPPPVCEVCERAIADVTDPMDHGVCRDCWREHREETD